MPRRLQAGSGGTVFHVMNRAARRLPIFLTDDDYEHFERLMVAAAERCPMRLLAYAIMPNHWHLVVWPQEDHDLSRYMQWLTRTHAQSWHRLHESVGTGALYQGRFRSVPVQNDDHLLMVCRYVEQNPLRARLGTASSPWRWTSDRSAGSSLDRPAIDEWPVARPSDWRRLVATADFRYELEATRTRIQRGLPIGNDTWTRQTARLFGLDSRLRGPGRPTDHPSP
jgi:putative transposase